jgi:hypothetical protein
VPTITTVFTIQATAPHWAKRAIVSMSLVTRDVRTPRLASLWSATLKEWMCVKARIRRLRSIVSAVVTRRM